jgi:hypothetical protein
MQHILVRLAAISVAALAAWAFAGAVEAQWAWKDENGRVVFSDRAPPPGVKPEQIVRQPGNRASTAQAPGSASAPAGDTTKAAAATGPKSWAEKDAEFRKRQQERADAGKKSAEEEAQKQRLAQDCDRMRGYLRQLEEGTRVARTDAQGNREILDDAQRASETARARDEIAKNCR